VKARLLVPEVIQTSDSDGGTAALKALLGGFGVELSYSRLRDAFQSDDGYSSIDALADLARRLGVQAEDAIVPPDLLLADAAQRLPAIVEVRVPGGGRQTVVAWRVHGPWVQVMDPANGRMFQRRQDFLDSLVVTGEPLTDSAFDEWSKSTAFRGWIDSRLAQLGVQCEPWADAAALDASLRFAMALLAAGQLRRGAQASEFLRLCAEQPGDIPERFRVMQVDAQGKWVLRGTRVLSLRPPGDMPAAAPAGSLLGQCQAPAPGIGDSIRSTLRVIGWRLPAAAACALAAAACGTVIEAFLFRGLFDIGQHLQSITGRIGLVLALTVFLAALVAIDWGAMTASYRIGRRIEWRVRTRFMWKIPRVHDRYFQSHLISDMAFRAHSLQLLRQVPTIAGDGIHYGTGIIVTGLAIALIYPGSWPLVAGAVFAACGVPLLFLPAMNERDMRYRETSALLGAAYLDSLSGTAAIRAHCAERTLRAVHSVQLLRWVRSALRRQVLVVRAEALQLVLTLAFVGALIYQQAAATVGSAGLLLLIYWATSIPQLGLEVAKLFRSVPAMRNTHLRFLELIESPEDEAVSLVPVAAQGDPPGFKIDFDAVTVVSSGGQVLLERINLHVPAGQHVGVVGVSGAGKSSFLGCLLGWHPASQGTIRIDDQPLDAPLLAQLRAQTAWIDPQVHLFRTTLFENLRYGNGGPDAARIAEAISSTDLERILKYSPNGLQSQIGENGTLISGGEGQRIRAARAFGRKAVRLAILDEPLRGLSRADRRNLLAKSRERFARATLFCVTHDVSDTTGLDHVVVIERGQIIEQGAPKELLAIPGSRYNALIREEGAVVRDLWSDPSWRRLRMRSGSVHPGDASAGAGGAAT
jgi:ABC-type multidrug transport system fused ATPase/permease subunit